MTTERERRQGLNEAVFREVNERILEISERFETSSEPMDLVCECGDRDCEERISMAMVDYEQVRADPLQFAIVPGHENAAVEVVIAKMKTYDLVRKRAGGAAEIAEHTDPRSD